MPRRLGSNTANVSLYGEQVRRLRMERGLTQAEFAHRVSLSTGYISLVENDRVEGISSVAAQSIAAALDTPLAGLIRRAQKSSGAAPTDPLPGQLALIVGLQIQLLALQTQILETILQNGHASQSDEPERVLLSVRVDRRAGLIHDLATVIAEEGLSVKALSTSEHQDESSMQVVVDGVPPGRWRGIIGRLHTIRGVSAINYI